MSMPPTNPTLPVFDAIAAAMPTRNEPSCSLNTIDWTLGSSTTASTMANLRFGNSLATFSMPLAWEKPIPTTIVEPRRAMLRSACSRWASLVTSNSRYALPVSFLERYALADAGRGEDLHGGSARLLRSRATLLQFRARAVRGGPRLRGARSLDPDRSSQDRGCAAAAVRAREARGLAEAEP